MHFMTDSAYVANVVEKGPTGRANGWHRPDRAPLQNLDLVRQLVQEWQSVWSIEWVKGHD